MDWQFCHTSGGKVHTITPQRGCELSVMSCFSYQCGRPTATQPGAMTGCVASVHLLPPQ